MPFKVIYYHVIWTTKNRQPLITPQIEALIVSVIHDKSKTIHSPIHAINAVEDHIHIAVSISPSIAVAEWVKTTKGASSYEVNKAFPKSNTHFAWQTGYGVLTFGKLALPDVIRYIELQKQHHHEQTLQPYLEQTEDGT